MEFGFRTAERTISRITRVYRSECGLVGKVVRTPVRSMEYGKPRTAYFVWAEPDSATEYKTADEALEQAQRQEGE